MDDLNRILTVAASQLGTVEDPRGSNNVPYNTAYYGHPVSGSRYPWCMVFIWWVFREAGLSALFYDGAKTASCTTLMKWAKYKQQWVTGDYKPGDVLLYQFDSDDYADHTGILVSVQGNRLQVIEGNTNDEVRQVWRDASQLHGAWRPPYAQDTAPVQHDDDDVVYLPELKRGDGGPGKPLEEAVRAMQILLIGRGFSCGPDAADGDFGVNTQLGLLQFQRKAGRPADGVCNNAVWRLLLGV